MSAWLRFIGRRIASALIVLWVVLSLVFALAYLLPADPARAALGSHADAATVARVRHEMCLDQPFLNQYGCYVGRILKGDLGTSFQTRRPVADLLHERLGPTVELALAAVLLRILLAVPLALLSAARRDRPVDHAVQASVVVLENIPPFVLGPLLIYVLAYQLGLLPVTGAGDSGIDRVRHLVLPALTLAAGGLATTARLLRGELVFALEKEFIRTARAKGASRFAILVRHALPNAALPVIGLSGVDLGALLGGAAVTEYVFGRLVSGARRSLESSTLIYRLFWASW
jgi:peptide/nickel transport system permease protein